MYAIIGTDTFVPCCRYLSHFRSVHRGAYFAELRTTTVRKLMPEAWGFLCPVHTPDGSPCGLLNHFSAMCRLVTKRPELMEDTEVAVNMVVQVACCHAICHAVVTVKKYYYSGFRCYYLTQVLSFGLKGL